MNQRSTRNVFHFLKSKSSPHTIQKSHQPIVTLVLHPSEITSGKLNTLEIMPKVVMGYVPPSLDFSRISQEIKRVLPSDTVVVLSSTAGELCTFDHTRALGNLYSQESIDKSEKIVLMLFDTSMIHDVFVASIPLHSETMGSVKSVHERIEAISKEIEKVRLPFKLSHEDTLGYTLIDGLSASESFYGSSIQCWTFSVFSDRWKCRGKLDFQATYLFDNARVVRHHAVITFIKFKAGLPFCYF